MRALLRALAAISKIPETNSAEWLSSAERSVQFLIDSVHSEQTILFASAPYVFIHGVLAPLKKLNPPDQTELMRDFVSLDNSWIIEHASGGGKPDRVYLEAPLGSSGKSLKGGEKLIFKRSFAGQDTTPIELSQKLVHALDLHFIPERNAYCRLNEEGDLEDVISVIEQRHKNWSENVTVIAVLAKDFSEYMRLSNMGLVWFFDFTRVDHKTFMHWANQKRFDYESPDLFYEGGVMPHHASYVNGRMIVRPVVTRSQIVQARMALRNRTNREYAIFKAINLRTGKRIEVSCNPACLSNYFDRNSTLPLEMSPAFFKAEVLHKYKADPEKYTLEDRSITCRGAWHLETYDINEEGQVHTYLRYLQRLPYKEQLYWQSFNEWPKASISKRAYTIDFEGQFFTDYDPLSSLKRRVNALDAEGIEWWEAREDRVLNAVHYPATDSPAEWANEVLALDQMIVEGFKPKILRVIATKLGRSPQAEWQSLKLVEECLLGSGTEEDEAKSSVSCLRLLHELRSQLKGHANPEKRAMLEKQARSEFGTFRNHFTDLASKCDRALGEVIDGLRKASKKVKSQALQ